MIIIELIVEGLIYILFEKVFLGTAIMMVYLGIGTRKLFSNERRRIKVIYSESDVDGKFLNGMMGCFVLSIIGVLLYFCFK